jgi:putative membrane protein insertion efficiency factor
MTRNKNRMKQIPKTVVLFLLRGYKWALSPLFFPACRYVPSCSEYAMEAVDRYGAARGCLMAAWRVLRCHPLAKGGLDPVIKTVIKTTKAIPNISSMPARPGRDTELCTR